MMREDARRMAADLIRLAPIFTSSVLRPIGSCPGCPLTAGQLQALICIQCQPGLNMTALAQRLGVSRQQLTRTVDALVAQGLVERITQADNRRVILLRATPQAACLWEQLADALSESLFNTLESLSGQEQQALTGACETITKILLRHLPAGREEDESQ